VIARFEAERQALAMMDHPNIAKVLDAGATETGRPYFVMELVQGVCITEYCDQNNLSTKDRLALFIQVCQAVQHAHQKGIIHRDIKPSNVMVTQRDGEPVPKVIDFGIAKATNQPLTDNTFVTFQGQLLGTLEYMSPEQVDFGTQDIDTRSDIYSLGVVLYELLSGVFPFDHKSFEHADFSEVQRTIREVEPASPSARLTGLNKGAKAIAACRGTQVIALARRLHRELEWIPLKAMRKDRSRRYRSASEMADDIRNYLDGLPLIAGPETTVYRLRKFVHKHVGSVTTAAVIALVIVLGSVVGAKMYFEAEDARETEFDPTGAGNNIDLGTLGGVGSRAYCINDAGQIVGDADSSQDHRHGALYDPTGAGGNIDLGTLGGDSGVPRSISEGGQITGFAKADRGLTRATLFDPSGGGNNIDLGTLGGDGSWAYCINDAGQIVGTSEDRPGAWGNATLFDPTGAGNNIDLGTLGGDTSIARSINNAGQIVGSATNSQGDWRACLFDPTGAGDNLDLTAAIDPASGWILTEASDINASGRIVGRGVNLEGQVHGFLLVPRSPCQYALAGDLNDDCKVDFADLAVMLMNWLVDCTAEPTNPACVPKP